MPVRNRYVVDPSPRRRTFTRWGLLLYELLAGKRPFDFSSGAISECERVICEVDPRPPSAASAELRRLDGDLDHIVMKALRKEPTQRYHSAEHLSDDVARFLAGLPVEARSGAWTYRARKFMRRRRIALAIGGALALTLGVEAVGLFRAERSTRQAQRQSNARLEAALTMANASLFDVHDSLAKMPGSTQVARVDRGTYRSILIGAGEIGIHRSGVTHRVGGGLRKVERYSGSGRSWKFGREQGGRGEREASAAIAAVSSGRRPGRSGTHRGRGRRPCAPRRNSSPDAQ